VRKRRHDTVRLSLGDAGQAGRAIWAARHARRSVSRLIADSSAASLGKQSTVVNDNGMNYQHLSRLPHDRDDHQPASMEIDVVNLHLPIHSSTRLANVIISRQPHERRIR
jgi:hypothetical protein